MLSDMVIGDLSTSYGAISLVQFYNHGISVDGLVSKFDKNT